MSLTLMRMLTVAPAVAAVAAAGVHAWPHLHDWGGDRGRIARLEHQVVASRDAAEVRKAAAADLAAGRLSLAAAATTFGGPVPGPVAGRATEDASAAAAIEWAARADPRPHTRDRLEAEFRALYPASPVAARATDVRGLADGRVRLADAAARGVGPAAGRANAASRHFERAREHAARGLAAQAVRRVADPAGRARVQDRLAAEFETLFPGAAPLAGDGR